MYNYSSHKNVVEYALRKVGKFAKSKDLFFSGSHHININLGSPLPVKYTLFKAISNTFINIRIKV